MDFKEKLQKCHGYLNALEEERCKIEMFQRELPLCLELVTRAIEACKQQISDPTDVAAAVTTTECLNGQSECSEQTTSNGPVFEEFIPIKRSYSLEQAKQEDEDDSGELESRNNSTKFNSNDDKSCSGKKSDWLRSVQLWNQAPDPPTTIQDNQINRPRKVSVVEFKRNGGAFHPFKREKTAPVSPNPAPSEHASPAPAAGKEEEGQQRKSRRCWSPELHRRFLNALQQLGGSHVATPKQIKELMKVDGLTNDEVKSHLQKYRLHTRRPAPTVHNNTSTQAPQFVVVGGIWVPPAVPPCHQATATVAQTGTHSQGARCNSSSTSSSTHTTTASQA
ncbi:hypothetical protein V2J09_012823 [Rumex salicifolius]